MSTASFPSPRAIHSANLNAGSDFPYLFITVADGQSFPRNPGFRVLHWHEDLQFIYISAGRVQLKTLDGNITLHKGEGVFINQNVVHLVRELTPCRYNSFIFPGYLLHFSPGGPVQQAVVSFCGTESLRVIHLKPSVTWQARLLKNLKHLARLEREKTALYQCEVISLLFQNWLLLARHTPSAPAVQDDTCKRMQKFLHFIETRYADPLSLGQIAAAAYVSPSECLRCFKRTLQTTPYRYLLERRLSRAAALLKNTRLPIGTVAVQSGFGQASHFGQCFKKRMGCTPAAYRRRFPAGTDKPQSLFV